MLRVGLVFCCDPEPGILGLYLSPRRLVGPAAMKHGMRLGDYLDIEWFLDRDRNVDSTTLLSRDRELGLEARAISLPLAEYAGFWLRSRRQDEASLPSRIYARAMTMARWIVTLVMFLAGMSLVRGLLVYSGTKPVNVSIFLLLAVAVPFGLSMLSVLFLAARALGWKGSFPAGALAPLLARLPGGWARQQVTFIQRICRGRGWLGRMLAWDFFALMHRGGLSFAAGSMLGMLGSVAVMDVAFGWQSTLSIGARGMHDLAAMLALPWSWMHPALLPTVAQVEGSRIILKDGIATLVSSDLAAWWPFLTMCLVVYALLPRLVLLVVARIGLRRLEDGWRHPDLERVLDRMQAPVIESRPVVETVHVPLPVAADKNDPQKPEMPATGTVGCVVLLPYELAGKISEDDLHAAARRSCGYDAARIMVADLEPGEMDRVRRECTQLSWQGGRERYVLVIEGWQPPIREHLLALQRLGGEDGRGASLTLILTGRPGGGQWWTNPTDAERQAWLDAIARLAPLRPGLCGALS